MPEQPLAEFIKRKPEPTLLDAVDALTKSKANIITSAPHTHTWKKSRLDHDAHDVEFCEWCDVIRGTQDQLVPTRMPVKQSDKPLLDQLRDAIGNNVGGTGGGKQARERTPIDIAAFALYEMIDGRIRSWLDDLGTRAGKDETPTEILRAWYAKWIGHVRDEHRDKSFQTILEGWEQAIKDKLDPPKRIEIKAPCPVCGKEWVNIGLKLDDGAEDPNDVERVRVLNAVERESITESYVLCTACETVWAGVPRMRELRIWIDDQEAAKQRTSA